MWNRRGGRTIIGTSRTEAAATRRRGPGRNGASAVDNNVMKIVYTFFLGALLALFVGLGIQTFYPGPEMPEYPVALEYPYSPSAPAEATEEQRQLQERHAQAMERWEEQRQTYNRNVGVLTLVAAVLLLVLSLLVERRNKVLTNGVMLGGLFTLFYAIGRSFASSETTMTFLAVGVGLAVVLFLGHRRFFQEPPAEVATDGRGPV